jgi:hypothetical protein
LQPSTVATTGELFFALHAHNSLYVGDFEFHRTSVQREVVVVFPTPIRTTVFVTSKPAACTIPTITIPGINTFEFELDLSLLL